MIPPGFCRCDSHPAQPCSSAAANLTKEERDGLAQLLQRGLRSRVASHEWRAWDAEGPAMAHEDDRRSRKSLVYASGWCGDLRLRVGLVSAEGPPEAEAD